ncbi:hypothetical protein HV213_26535 [Klebsiella sp. RHBSTW-00484]|uniref:hypothetical protein n=1 Tax=unclassified Klebsiella TaxID=2608929 RepID=UPI0015E53B28|nr:MULTISPECIES: hypothetical protein [unclassified Klebsiella]MBA7843776.1 hypothetical protein [Klebsiella sp. RHBSTW-00465]QLO39128.1 hypothetical protein HV213_26535 [Klebsiella sp. RHBSTW-00484]QLT78649.1 hypothetical protein HV204_26535 [Klebsiella sp. RHBSTW-00464]
MKQLTVFEMEEISGGSIDLMGALDFIVKEIGAIGLGASLGAAFGSGYAGRWGGVGGGILGFGALGQGVGMIAGLFIGGIGFGVAAGIAGWDKTYELAQKAINSILDGTFNLWSDN